VVRVGKSPSNPGKTTSYYRDWQGFEKHQIVDASPAVDLESASLGPGGLQLRNKLARISESYLRPNGLISLSCILMVGTYK